MGAYLATHDNLWIAEHGYSIVVEQGHDVGRDGRVHVTLIDRQAPFEVRIAGAASYVRDLNIAD
jgi:predicted PhzF superfamily epimerase YddE/YHI9